MEEIYEFNGRNNSAKTFFIMVKKLKQIAEERKVEPQVVIREYISDLKNINDENYTVKIEQLKPQGDISSQFIKSAIQYLNRSLKEMEANKKSEEQKQKREQKEEEFKRIIESVETFIEQNTQIGVEEILVGIKEKRFFPDLNSNQRKNVIKKVEELIENNRKEKAKKEEIEKTWESICEIVEKGSKKERVTKVEYWIAVRAKILKPEEGETTFINVSESIQEDVLKLVDDKIATEKEWLYYNQVKYFTRNFRFLKDYPEIVKAQKGTPIRKFTDTDSYWRFYELRELLQKGDNEQKQIEMLLNRGNLDETSRRILNQRMRVIKEQAKEIPNESSAKPVER